ncbi:zinc ribbon domain-containing protein [Chondromyces crocatus]|uniref:Uncharacterized protein n=1 Tax=Chondromyces crocatus TaxID=52 RepID=A0A0K1EBR6_CHOCO|nr:tetratricopeptide repeat protein [Chondromyces crocatus]AKT38112.1 uncharacterized protein CMC5_022540 [Chondromyces crocatus]
MVTCTFCGAPVSPRDPSCSYCGRSNQRHQPSTHHVQALLSGARTLHQAANHIAAIVLFRQVIAEDPELFDAYFFLADSLTSLHDFSAAIQAMERAQSIRPGHFAVQYNLGALHKRQGNAPLARHHFERSLEIAKSAAGDHESFRAMVEQELASLPPKGHPGGGHVH